MFAWPLTLMLGVALGAVLPAEAASFLTTWGAGAAACACSAAVTWVVWIRFREAQGPARR